MLTRDTAGYAAKGSWFEVKTLVDEATDNDLFDEATDQYETKEYNIYKDPVTDDGQKRSLKGLLQVTENLQVKQECTWEEESQGLLQTIYEDGQFFNQTTLSEIRERVNKK